MCICPCTQTAFLPPYSTPCSTRYLSFGLMEFSRKRKKNKKERKMKRIKRAKIKKVKNLKRRKKRKGERKIILSDEFPILFDLKLGPYISLRNNALFKFSDLSLRVASKRDSCRNLILAQKTHDLITVRWSTSFNT